MEDSRKSAARVLYLLLAFATALGIWFYVDEFGNNGGPFLAQQVVTEIPIEYTGAKGLVNRGLMLLTDGETSQSVDLKFEGARRLVTSLDRSHLRVTASLSGVTSAGVQTVQYTVDFLDDDGRASSAARQKYAKISTVRQTPESATVDIEELARKELDIRCELVGTVAEGFSAGQPQLSQSTVEIQGTEEDIAAVSYAKVTLDLGDGANESVTQELTCQFYDGNNQQVDRDDFYPSVDRIQVTLPVYVTKELPLVVNYTESAGARLQNTTRRITPETVTVSGEASRLRDVNEITLGDLNLVDLVGAGRMTYIYTIPIPEGCHNQSGTTRATLEISLKDLVISQIVATRFASGSELPDGRTAEVQTESLPVSVFGTAQAVGAVTAENITVTPVLSDYTAASGVYTVSASVDITGAGDVGVAGSYEVQVLIRDQEPGEDETEADSGTDGTEEDSDSTADNSAEDTDANTDGSAQDETASAETGEDTAA